MTLKRADIAELAERHWDLVLIGGGITGAAVAHQAALCGLSVALFEMNDFGSATSSATSKLIHGGLRYLKNFELGLVRESLRERRIIADIAPNFVQPLQFLVPRYRRHTARNFALRAGMWLYDGLSYDKAHVVQPSNRLRRHGVLSTSQTLQQAAWLQHPELHDAVTYFDYANINPDRMTLAFLQTAQDHGAQLANYARVESLELQDSSVRGVTVRDTLTGHSRIVRAHWVINCAGTWVHRVLKMLKRPSVSPGDLPVGEPAGQHSTPARSEGVHLLTAKIPVRTAVVLQTRAGDHLMFLPWRGLTIIGPTDKPYHGTPDDYRPTRASVDELLDKVNQHIAPEEIGGALTRDDIVFHYGGLRPLAGLEDSDNPYTVSRRYELVDHGTATDDQPFVARGLLSVEGGKYTTSRGLAQRVVEHIARSRQLQLPLCDSATYTLHPCRIGDFSEFLNTTRVTFGKFYPDDTIQYYVRNYGTLAADVLELGLKTSGGATRLTADGEIQAELDYTINHELAYSLADVLLRRTGVGWLGRPADATLRLVVERLSKRRNWSTADCEHAIHDFISKYYTIP